MNEEEMIPLSVDINKLAEMVSAKIQRSEVSRSSVYQRGEKYFFRTVTHYFTGTVVEITDNEIVITDACWIADTGRYSKALSEGVFSEMEPYPEGKRVILNRGSFIDSSIWGHDLPRTVK